MFTKAGNLHVKYIIHAVTPTWSNGDKDEEKRLEKCIYNSLLKASDLNIETIALPAISSGTSVGFGFPKHLGAEIMIKSCLEFAQRH